VNVDYDEEYQVMNFMKDSQPQVKVALLRKFKRWEYEKERRIIVPGGAHRYQPFRPEALSSIVFGCRATTDVREKIHEIPQRARQARNAEGENV
jgi:hypothetical protein